jgi:hypothetical protein
VSIVYHVGRVVLDFSAIENALGFMYSMQTGPTPGHAGRKFYTHTDMKTKIALADRVASSKLEGHELRAWRRVLQSLHRVRQIRNLVSHQVLVNVYSDKTVETMLRPGWFRPARKNARSLRLEEIQRAADELRSIREDIWKVVYQVQGI